MPRLSVRDTMTQLTKRQMNERRRSLRPHPVRDRIVEVMRAYGRPISPTQIARITGGTLGSVAYHVRTLNGAGVIVLADEGRVRGAVEHLYALAPGAETDALNDPSEVMLSLCGTLIVQVGADAMPRPAELDDEARLALHELLETLKPKVCVIAEQSTVRAIAA